MRIDVSGVKETSSLTRANHAHDLDVTLCFSSGYRDVVAAMGFQTLQERAIGLKAIALIANGGDGMDGLHGRNGAAGRDGRKGWDATRYGSGTNGENGGRGGDGEPGTSGGPGGRGGDVTLRVAQDETDILSVVWVQNYGGKGGAAGSHGQGGRGGRGGRGGDTYNRTETDCHGKTVHIYHSGGLNGSDGPSGRTPTTPLYPGSNGRHGSLSIRVSCTDGTVRVYSGIYNLTLGSFKSRSSTDNGIYEPGDTIEVSHIQIYNNGEMPTPRGKQIAVSVVSHAAMSSNTQVLYLLDEIPPKSSVVLPGSLFFTLKEYTGNGASPLSENMTLDLMAVAPRLQYQFSGFSKPHTVKLSHPIQIDQVYNPRALLAREYALVAFTVRNTSLKELGSAATMTALQREIQLACGVGSDEPGGGKLVFCDASGRTVSAPKLFFSISKIDPKAPAVVSCYVKVEQNKESHVAHSVGSQLRLQKIGNATELKLIDTRTVEIKEGIPYAPRPQDDFLLVTNADTSADELRAWHDIARDLGLSFSVWDTAVYHHMRLHESAPAVDKGSSLLKRWQGKLLVVLNQGDNTHTPSTAPLGFISQQEFDEALRKAHMRFYTVGTPMAADQRPSLMEVVPIDGKRFYESVDLFNEASDKDLLSSKYAHVVTVSRTRVKGIGASAEVHFAELVEKIRRDLDRRFPNSTFLIVPEFRCTVTKKWAGGVVQQEQLGRVEIQCEESPPEAMVLGIDAQPHIAHKPNFVRSKMNKVALLASLTPDRLVAVFIDAITIGAKDLATVELIMNALTHRIAAEAGFTASADEKSPFRGLPTLVLLKEQILSKTNKQIAPLPSVMSSMVARLQELRTQEVAWYQRWFSIGRKKAVAATLAEHTKAIEQHLAACYSKSDLAFYKQILDATTKSCSKARAKLLDQLLGRTVSSPSSIVSHNPYVSRVGTNSADYAQRFQHIEKRIDENIRTRARMVRPV